MKQAKRFGHQIPDRIKNKPELLAGLSLYLDAFFELLNDSNEVGLIPWSVVVKYAEYYEFSREQTDLLVYFVKALNAEYLKHSRRKGKNG